MSFKKSVVLLLTVAVFACFGSPSIVVNGESIELTEVGEELATKAAEVYLEELYPDSPATMGPAGPVYSLALDGSIAGWFFVIDAEGESNLTVEEMQEIASYYTHKYHEHYITGDDSLKPDVTSGYREAMLRYQGMLISNYREYNPLLKSYLHIPFQEIEYYRYDLERIYDVKDNVLLFSKLGTHQIYPCFVKRDSDERVFITQVSTITTVFSSKDELSCNIGGIEAKSITTESKENAGNLWEKIENEQEVSDEMPSTSNNYYWNLECSYGKGYYYIEEEGDWDNHTTNGGDWIAYCKTYTQQGFEETVHAICWSAE